MSRGLEARPPQGRAEWDNPLPCLAGDAVPDAPQDRGGPPDFQGTADPYPTRHGPGPFHGTAPQPLIPQSVHPGLHHPRCRIWHLPFINFICLVIAQCSLQGLLTLEGVNSSSQFCVIYKLAQYPSQSCIQVIYGDVEEHRAENGALQSPASDRSPV